MQLATGRDRRKRLSLLRLGGRPWETLLPAALQIGVSTGSQKPQGCCGRLMLGRERKPDSSDIRPDKFSFPQNRGANPASMTMPLRSRVAAPAAISAPFCSSQRTRLERHRWQRRTLLYETHAAIRDNERSLLFQGNIGVAVHALARKVEEPAQVVERTNLVPVRLLQGCPLHGMLTFGRTHGP